MLLPTFIPKMDQNFYQFFHLLSFGYNIKTHSLFSLFRNLKILKLLILPFMSFASKDLIEFRLGSGVC